MCFLRQILGIEDQTVSKIKETLPKLPPMQISKKGYLMEWLQDYEEVEPQHRHVSHLYGLFPANQISPNTTPELAAASIETLNGAEMAVQAVMCLESEFLGQIARWQPGLQTTEKLIATLYRDECINRCPTTWRYLSQPVLCSSAISKTEISEEHHNSRNADPKSGWQYWTTSGATWSVAYRKFQKDCARGGATIDAKWTDKKDWNPDNHSHSRKYIQD